MLHMMMVLLSVHIIVVVITVRVLTTILELISMQMDMKCLSALAPRLYHQQYLAPRKCICLSLNYEYIGIACATSLRKLKAVLR